jgi:hypothetical protein
MADHTDTDILDRTAYERELLRLRSGAAAGHGDMAPLADPTSHRAPSEPIADPTSHRAPSAP